MAELDLCLQKVELRCLLPRSLLDHGFTSGKVIKDFDKNENSHSHHSGYSWSGQRKAPSYLNKLIFPGEFLTSLRTISLQEHELIRVSALLEEVISLFGLLNYWALLFVLLLLVQTRIISMRF